MNSTYVRFIDLVRRASQGHQDSLNQLLERYRGYLKVLALRQLDSRVEPRVDASDLVQQTCMSVVAKIQDFTGENETDFIAWLKTIHERNIKNAVRDHIQAKKRSISREAVRGNEKIDGYFDETNVSPSQRIMLGEQIVLLTGALESLAEDQREAVRLRYLEGMPLTDIANRMDRTVDSAAGLVKRGLIQLRKLMRE